MALLFSSALSDLGHGILDPLLAALREFALAVLVQFGRREIWDAAQLSPLGPQLYAEIPKVSRITLRAQSEGPTWVDIRFSRKSGRPPKSDKIRYSSRAQNEQKLRIKQKRTSTRARGTL